MSEPEAPPERKRRLSKRARGIIVSVLILLGLQWLEYTGWLPLINGRILDSILRVHSSQKDSDASKNIYTIEIDDAAYERCFRSQSPMDPQRIMNLVTAVAEANPKTIGVDIRTESPQYAAAIDGLKSMLSSIVWISAPKEILSCVAPFPSWLLGDRDRTVVTASPVLGDIPYELPRQRQTNWGVPLFPRDEDESVRRFPRSVEVATAGSQGQITVPSWARRVADVYCAPGCKNETADEVYLSYAGKQLHRYAVSDLFSCPGSDHSIQPNEPWDELKGSLFGKLVLIGGTFKESGDFYRTPNGRLPGLVINAYAVKSELNGSGLAAVNQPIAWMLDLALGLLIVAVCDDAVLKKLGAHQRFIRPRRAKILLSTLIVITFCVGSLIFAGRYLLGFAGEGVGVLIDRMRDLWEFSGGKES